MTSAAPYGAADFARDIPVSRETLAALERYAMLLADWQARMNLVGPATLPDLWQRHMLDSAQLLALVPDPASARLLDIGSGAGFPGLVLSILGVGAVTLVESTAKKARFLAAVAQETGVAARVTVANTRIEALPPFPASVITARACAALDQLLAWGAPFAAPGCRWILPKGRRAETELESAARTWHFSVTTHPSRSDPSGRILVLDQVQRKTPPPARPRAARWRTAGNRTAGKRKGRRR